MVGAIVITVVVFCVCLAVIASVRRIAGSGPRHASPSSDSGMDAVWFSLLMSDSTSDSGCDYSDAGGGDFGGGGCD
jgi:hypothetical protein